MRIKRVFKAKIEEKRKRKRYLNSEAYQVELKMNGEMECVLPLY